MLSDLAFALAEDGFNVTVVTSRLRYDDAECSLPSKETVRGVRVRRVWTSRYGRKNLLLRSVDYLTFYLSTLLLLLRICGRADVIVAKTDPPMLSVVSAIVGVLRGSNTINWLQDVFPEVAGELGVLNKRGILFELLRRLRNWSLRRASFNVALGQRMAECIASCGIASENIKVIPNWADGEAIAPIQRDENPLRESWAIGDRFIVGYCGNLGRAHDWEGILEAATRLEVYQELVFVIVGGGAGYSALKRGVDELCLSNVIFKPYQPRDSLRFTLSLPDVQLISLNPKLEGFVLPSKIYGILAAGKPFVFSGSDSGDISQIASEGSFGFVTHFGNGFDLSETLLSLHRDSVNFESITIASRAHFDSRYTMSNATSSWKSLFFDVFEEPYRALSRG